MFISNGADELEMFYRRTCAKKAVAFRDQNTTQMLNLPLKRMRLSYFYYFKTLL
jgi:hypothetical protein